MDNNPCKLRNDTYAKDQKRQLRVGNFFELVALVFMVVGLMSLFKIIQAHF